MGRAGISGAAFLYVGQRTIAQPLRRAAPLRVRWY
jgi:hypothetical protein